MPKSSTFVFQALNWSPHDVVTEEDSSESDEEERRGSSRESSEFVVKIFGRTQTGESCTINVVNFTPFFLCCHSGNMDLL